MVPQTYSEGGSPAGIAFDGTNLWVTNVSGNSVTALLASTGAVVGTYSVGSYPRGIAFDGTNIWVANQNSNNVSKLLASSGMVVGTYPVGSQPIAIAFDGTNIWVTTTLATASLSCWPALGRCSAPTLSEQILGVWPSTEPRLGGKQRQQQPHRNCWPALGRWSAPTP